MATKVTPEKAYAEGQKAKVDGVPADKNPYQGERGRDADDEARYKSYLRDCWSAGHYGEEHPAPYKGDLPK